MILELFCMLQNNILTWCVLSNTSWENRLKGIYIKHRQLEFKEGYMRQQNYTAATETKIKAPIFKDSFSHSELHLLLLNACFYSHWSETTNGEKQNSPCTRLLLFFSCVCVCVCVILMPQHLSACMCKALQSVLREALRNSVSSNQVHDI